MRGSELLSVAVLTSDSRLNSRLQAGQLIFSPNSMSPTLSLNANVNYLSKRPTAQGEDSRFLTPNLALKKNFKDSRYSLSLQWQYIDLGMHQSNRQRITTWGEDFYTSTNYIYETDIIMLNFSYNLNWKNGKSKLPSSEFGEKEF